VPAADIPGGRQKTTKARKAILVWNGFMTDLLGYALWTLPRADFSGDREIRDQ